MNNYYSYIPHSVEKPLHLFGAATIRDYFNLRVHIKVRQQASQLNDVRHVLHQSIGSDDEWATVLGSMRLVVDLDEPMDEPGHGLTQELIS